MALPHFAMILALICHSLFAHSCNNPTHDSCWEGEVGGPMPSLTRRYGQTGDLPRKGFSEEEGQSVHCNEVKSICKITYHESCLFTGRISPVTPEQSTPVLYHENKVSSRKQVAKKSNLRNRKNRAREATRASGVPRNQNYWWPPFRGWRR